MCAKFISKYLYIMPVILADFEDERLVTFKKTSADVFLKPCFHTSYCNKNVRGRFLPKLNSSANVLLYTVHGQVVIL